MKIRWPPERYSTNPASWVPMGVLATVATMIPAAAVATPMPIMLRAGDQRLDQVVEARAGGGGDILAPEERLQRALGHDDDEHHQIRLEGGLARRLHLDHAVPTRTRIGSR